MERSSTYIIGFAAAVCLVCGVFVSSSAVALKSKQEDNKVLDRQKKVLVVAGLVENGGGESADEIRSLFADHIKTRIIDLKSGKYLKDDPSFDQRKAAKDPEQSREVSNPAQVKRIPHNAIVYHKMKNGQVDRLILPIEGKGLWSTLYGFLALGKDANTVKGIIFYEHGETPGLGGEIENPRWMGLWPGKLLFKTDAQGLPKGDVKLEVKKGQATPGDAYAIDGLSGATITSRGVTHLVHLWMSDEAFGPYLRLFRDGQSSKTAAAPKVVKPKPRPVAKPAPVQVKRAQAAAAPAVNQNSGSTVAQPEAPTGAPKGDAKPTDAKPAATPKGGSK
jgi:Na+-transporting NADH:ubiquinone oxidoreductase subunit C